MGELVMKTKKPRGVAHWRPAVGQALVCVHPDGNYLVKGATYVARRVFLGNNKGLVLVQTDPTTGHDWAAWRFAPASA